MGIKHSISLDTLSKVSMMSLVLALLKLGAFLSTNSILVLASFIDSLADTGSSFINRYIHKKSIEKADKEHPFGHGGFEVFGSFMQGIFIAALGVNLIIQSTGKIFTLSHASYIDYSQMPLACLVLTLSAIGSLGIDWYFKKQMIKLSAAKERSLIILADKAHYRGDFWTNLLSALGLACIYFTNWSILDSFLGLGAGILLLANSFPILRKCYRDIVHSEAPKELQQEIVNIVLSVDHRIKGIHLLRSREFGPTLFVDFHMKVSENLSLREAHEIGDKTEYALKKNFPSIDLFIHLDPENEPDQNYWDPSYKIQ